MPNVPRRKLARLLKRVYHGCGTGKGPWEDHGKNLDVNISVELGPLLVCLCRCNDWGDLWVVFRTIAHGPVSVQDPDDSRVPVPSGPLAIFNFKPVLFALEPYSRYHTLVSNPPLACLMVMRRREKLEARHSRVEIGSPGFSEVDPSQPPHQAAHSRRHNALA